MKPELRFRPMMAGDLDAVAVAEAELHESPWSRGQLESSLAAGHAMWLAEAEGALAAYGVVMMSPDQAELLDIAVLKPWQGRGLGGQVLVFLLRQAVEAGARQMFLEVRASNQPALALYRRAGFGEVGRRRGYYPARTGREDALVMKKELP